MLKIFRTGKLNLDLLQETVENMVSKHGKVSLFLSDGIMLPPGHVLRKFPMEQVFVTRILTSHQLLRVLMEMNSTAYYICMNSKIMDDWKLSTIDSIYDVLRIRAISNHCDIAMNVVGDYSPIFSMATNSHDPAYGKINEVA